MAARGWPVVPVHSPLPSGRCSCGPACGSPGKHPRIRAWRSDATVAVEAIDSWWSGWPEANIGILTGARSGVMIIDVDHRNGGWEGLAQLENAHGSLPVTIKVRTGSGGLHLVFVHPGRNLRGGASRLGRGVDVLADGQFAVGVGSRHASGGTYVSTGSAIIGTCSVPRGKPARTGGRRRNADRQGAGELPLWLPPRPFGETPHGWVRGNTR